MPGDKDRPLYTRRRVIGLGATALGATAAAQLLPAYGAAGSVINSYNWSGARVTNDTPSFQQENFRSVTATWRVPAISIHNGEQEARSAAWIGLDGGTWGLGMSTYVLQAGTYHELSQNGGTRYFAFFLLDKGYPGTSTSDLYSNNKAPGVVINPGDTIAVKLDYSPGPPPKATATFTGFFAGSPKTLVIDNEAIKGDTVEWVFERISKNNDNSYDPKRSYLKTYYDLGNHDAVEFTSAYAMTDLGHMVTPDEGDSIYMLNVDKWPDLLTAGTASTGQVEIKQRYH